MKIDSNDLEKNEQVTRDYFYKKKVIVFQTKRGYRFSIDAPILADFIPVCESKALEIGTGCGIVSLLVLYKKKFPFIYGIEIQNQLAQLGKINAKKNGFEHEFEIIQGDFKKIFKSYKGIKHIFSNPPFLKLKSGRLSPNEEIRNAKSETLLTVNDVMEKSFSVMEKSGNLYLILPFSRYEELIEISKSTGFYIAREKMVFSFDRGKPERFLVQLTNYEVSKKKMEPLIIFKERGVYTSEMERILEGL